MGRRARHAPAVVVACVLFAATACTGVNIFPTGVSAGDDTGAPPTVDITQPAADAALTQGDSVRVSADVTSTTGLNQVTLSGSFISGTSAFEQQVVSFSGATDTTVSRFLQPAGTQTGDARIVVQATDLLGNVGVDTVLVSVN